MIFRSCYQQLWEQPFFYTSNMKKLILIIFSFLSSIDLIGQIKISGRVIDSHSKNGVSYASLRFIPLSSGCYTDSLGYFTFDLVQSNDADSLEISCIGYSSKKVKLLRQELLEIELNLENISLATVFVKANKDNKEEISFPVKKADYFFKASKPIEIITEIKVPNWKSNKQVFLDRVILMSKLYAGKIPCRLKIYEVNLQGIPGEQILPLSIIINEFSFSKKKVIIDLKKYKIPITNSSYFIGIEWLTNKSSTSEDISISVGITHKVTGANSYTRIKWENYSDWVKLNQKFGYPNPPYLLAMLVTTE